MCAYSCTWDFALKLYSYSAGNWVHALKYMRQKLYHLATPQPESIIKRAYSIDESYMTWFLELERLISSATFIQWFLLQC